MPRARLIWVTLALTAVVSGGVTAASASAAAKIKLLPGEENATLVTSNTTVGTDIESAAGLLTGTGFGLKTSISGSEASSGTYFAEFKNVEEPAAKVKCNTAGAVEGRVVIPPSVPPENEVKFVFDSLVTLGVAMLLKVKELTITCATKTITLRGTALGLMKPINTEVAAGSTTLKGVMHCSLTVGEPEEFKFWNEVGTEETAKLEINFGTGFKKACFNVAGEYAIEPSKMLEVAG